MNSIYPCSIENYVCINKVEKVLRHDYRESISLFAIFLFLSLELIPLS